MKILYITDGAGWCLDKLGQVVIDGNPQFEWKVLHVHPKEVVNHLPEIEEALEWADICWNAYFRTGAQIAELLPQEVGKVINVVTHHNQKDKAVNTEQAWVDYFICHTEKMKEKLQKRWPETPVEIIRHGIDIDFFDYDGNSYPPDSEFTVGYVGRTNPWKRLADVADVCGELGVRLVGMGRRDDAYANQVNWDHVTEWHENIPDDDRLAVYRKMNCFVQFCEDGVEEGTMPYLEAVMAGVPLITTDVGEARDLMTHEKNCLFVENKEQLKEAILRLKNDPQLCEVLRANAWDVVKHCNEDQMAVRHEKFFNKIWYKKDLVSVVIPTYKRMELLDDIMASLQTQDYGAIEVVLVDDDPEHSARDWVASAKNKYSIPIKYVWTNEPGYGLAKARNLGAIMAQGHYLLFMDDRYAPEPNAVRLLVDKLKADKEEKRWVFGNKGKAGKKEFVENFSAVRRRHFFDFGMFNERITMYGGMSQECRIRAIRQGFKLLFVPDAHAEILHKTRRKTGRRKQIWKMKSLLYRMGLSK